MQQIIEASNLTHSEYLHLNGKLSRLRTEQLITELDEAKAFDVREFASYAQEASGQYPAEDFLQEVISDLHYLAKRLRGENKDAILHAIEKLDDIAQCQVNATDYGREGLRKIISTIKRD